MLVGLAQTNATPKGTDHAQQQQLSVQYVFVVQRAELFLELRLLFDQRAKLFLARIVALQ
jgi:hypothetical protein